MMGGEKQIPLADSVGPRQSDATTAKDSGDSAFLAQLKKRTPRLFITPVLLVINVLVFGWMLSAGVSPIEPTSEDLIAWGADFGLLTFNG